MEVFIIGLLALLIPVVLLLRRTPHDEEHPVDEPTVASPAAPGAESMAVPDAGEVGPAAEPPRG